MKGRFFIETFGCQMNLNDSDLIALSLRSQGYEEAPSVEEADVVVYNTCSVRQHAEDRVLARIRSSKPIFRENNAKVVVAGCMAQRLGAELLKEDHVTLVVGPYQSPSIGTLIDQGGTYTSQEPQDLHSRLDPAITSLAEERPWHRWVTITHGCDNHCTYCIVPSVRGPLRSFDSSTILSHARQLAAHGAREITLLGQNVNQYGQDTGDIPFHSLLEQVASIPGLMRVNFLTSHPGDFYDDIIHVIRDNPVISRALHLPLQSGSDSILKRMNRRYTLSHYYSLIETIDRELESYSLSTDIIVGFPGESDTDFQHTLEAVKNIRFDEAYMYAYSEREGTPAASLKETLQREEKISRLNRLIALQRGIGREKLEAQLTSHQRVIFEKESLRQRGYLFGRSFLNHPVVVPADKNHIGKSETVQITGVEGATLQGELIA